MFRERTTQKTTDADRGAIVSLLREGASIAFVARSLNFDKKNGALVVEAL
jgi:hypothetical protein